MYDGHTKILIQKQIYAKKWENEQQLKDRLQELGYKAKGENVGYEMPTQYNAYAKTNSGAYGKNLELYPETNHQYQQAQQALNPADAEYYRQYYQNFQNYYKQYSQQNALNYGNGNAPSSNMTTTTKTTIVSDGRTTGPMTPQEIAAERQRQQQYQQQQAQAQAAQDSLKERMQALEKLNASLDLIDSVKGYM
mmetsp:Transcript_3096/g.4616  ORF Transcript_3096/g.4616 Transcript_3096/m.4616 type:complete len:193 (+) Transcript_3096:1173-1751(+)